MGEEWSRLVNATINRYVRAEERSILRSRRLVALLQREGRLLTLKTDHDHQRVKDWVRGIAHELDTAIRMAQEQGQLQNGVPEIMIGMHPAFRRSLAGGQDQAVVRYYGYPIITDEKLPRWKHQFYVTVAGDFPLDVTAVTDG